MMLKSKYVLVLLTSCVLTIPPANAYGFTLSVYGNANMDDIIDERDIEYIQGIIDGTEDETQFADANYDGLIDENDLDHIEAIIAGENVKLTLVDNKGITVSLDVPVNRVATLFLGALRPVVHLASIDKIVGVESSTLNMPYNRLVLQAHPELRGIPEIGAGADPSQEVIISLGPNVIFGGFYTDKETSQIISQNTGISFVYAAPLEIASFDKDEGAFETWRLMGLMLGSDERKRAEDLISYCDEKINEIEEITSEMPEEDKTRVYFACASAPTTTTNYYQPIEIAGGMNVAEGLVAGSAGWGGVDVSKEQIIDWDPEVILIHSISKEENNWWATINDVLSDPSLQTVSAIKNQRVYGTKGWDVGWDPATGLCECLYLAKIFHPEKFEDLNVEDECNEILEEFYGVPGLYDWMLENCGDYYTWR